MMRMMILLMRMSVCTGAHDDFYPIDDNDDDDNDDNDDDNDNNDEE